MKISLVICSRNRAPQLAATLGKLDLGDLTRNAVEVNLIDSASTDSSHEVMREFKNRLSVPVNIGQADTPGLGLARNVGIKLASGDVIVFTDDDCYIDADYFTQLSTLWDGSFQFGGGQILIDSSADPRVANLTIQQRMDIPPNTIVPAGFIQGANMFFARHVFQQAGLFNENLGSGTPFCCEDLEMATRASMLGFRGVLLPELKVFHNHGRKRGTPEAERTVEDYDFGRGAYYASLILTGNYNAWDLWARSTQGYIGVGSPAAAKLAREMAGARCYLEYVTKKLEEPQNEPKPTAPPTEFARQRGLIGAKAAMISRIQGTRKEEMSIGAPRQVDHWCRAVMNRETSQYVRTMNPHNINALEISGSSWQTMGFKSYQNVFYPDFDICKQTLPGPFDLVIAEQVFEHIDDPSAAARNILEMLRSGGTFLITTPFFIKNHPEPLDLWRWTAQGMKIFLERVGFVSVETFSWGNRACVVGNFEQWPMYDPIKHSLENEADFPLVVWGFALKAAEI